jgi:hypothetical protein
VKRDWQWGSKNANAVRAQRIRNQHLIEETNGRMRISSRLQRSLIFRSQPLREGVEGLGRGSDASQGADLPVVADGHLGELSMHAHAN